MLTRKYILSMTTAAAICAAPVLALGQANTGGSSQMQGTTQTTPQAGPLASDSAARGAATTGSDTGMAPNQGGIAGSAPAQGRTTNPAGNATGQPLGTSGGQAAAPGAPGATSMQGTPGPNQGQMQRIQQGQGNTTGNDARGGAMAQGAAPGSTNTRDGTPGNPPSTATQRAVDAVTGNRTDADGTGNNPPGTAAGRALDRATGGATTGQTLGNTPATSGGAAPRDGTPGNPPSTATGRAADAVTGNRTDADGTGNNPPGTTPGSTAPGAAAATGAAATGATTGAMAVDSMRLRDGRRASQVIGSNIYNEANQSIGEVDDLIIPTAGGQPVAIISVGGFLGIGARLVAVPYERLTWNSERNRWTLQGATRESLESLPAFTHDSNRRG